MVRKKMPAKVIKRRVFFTLFPRKSEKKMGRSNSRTVAPAKSNASLSGIGNRVKKILTKLLTGLFYAHRIQAKPDELAKQKPWRRS
jgi:hypothetical protein